MRTVTGLIKQSFAANMSTELSTMQILEYVNREYTKERGRKPDHTWRALRILARDKVITRTGAYKYQLNS
uniref:Uncharacterized protein n=1 Tax=viral metagenome TaxID=1070528 RepID=A0A6M3IM04_9ZZZZ